MFLQSIITNKLLPSPKQNTFHLKNYPTQAIRGICASSIPNLYQTCKYDHSKQKKQQQQLPQHSISNINALIPNYEALQWNVEIIGAAFALPLNDDADFNIISTTISLLSIWLQEPAEFLAKHIVNGITVVTPPHALNCINDDNKFEFYVSLIKCTTLLFMGRNNKQLTLNQKEKHFKLCCRTLKLLTKSIPVILNLNDLDDAKVLKLQEIYNIILRLILGIQHELLSLDNAVKMVRASAANTIAASKSHPYLSRRLAPYLIRTFYEILFISIPIFFTNNNNEDDDANNNSNKPSDDGMALINDIFALYITYSKEWWLVGGTNSMYVHYCVLEAITNIIVKEKLWNHCQEKDMDSSGDDNKKNNGPINSSSRNNTQLHQDDSSIIKINWLLTQKATGHSVGNNVDSEVFSIFKLWNKQTYITISHTLLTNRSNDIIYNLWYNLIKSTPDPSVFINGLSAKQTTEMLFNRKHKSLGDRFNQLTAINSSLDFSSAIDIISAIMLKLINIADTTDNNAMIMAREQKSYEGKISFGVKYFNSTNAITALNLFGVCLYQNATNLLISPTSTTQYKEGIVKCIETLCIVFNRIDMSNEDSKNITTTGQHVSHFYNILINGLNEMADIDCVKAILVYGRNVLIKNVKQNQILLESLIFGINKVMKYTNKTNGNTIWTKNNVANNNNINNTASSKNKSSQQKNNKTKLQNEVVRLSILKIIHNMICRSRRNRNNLLFSKQNGNSKSNGTSSEIDICEIIRKNTGRVLMTFLAKESNEYNLRYTFSILASKLYEDRKVPGIAQVTISTILSKFFHDNEWNDLVKRDAIMLLNRISSIVDHIHVSGTHTIPNMLMKYCHHVTNTLEGMKEKIIESSLVHAHANTSSNTLNATSNANELVKYVEISCLNIIDINNMVINYVQKAPWLITNHTAGHEIIKTSIKCCHIITLLESNTIIKQSTNYRKIFKITLLRIEKSGTVLLDACNNIGKKQSKCTYNYAEIPSSELSSCNYYSIGKDTIVSVKKRNIDGSNDDVNTYNMYQLTFRNSYGRIEWEGIPSQSDEQKAIIDANACIDSRNGGENLTTRSLSRDRLNSRLNYVPSKYHLLLTPEQNAMVRYAESIIHRAEKEGDLSTLSHDNIKKQVLEHFQNDSALYAKCSQTIKDLITKYNENLVLMDGNKKDKNTMEEAENTLMGAKSSPRGFRSSAKSMPQIDESTENTTVHEKNDTRIDEDPVHNMFQVLNESQEFVVNAKTDYNNNNNNNAKDDDDGNKIINKIDNSNIENSIKLFQRQKSCCNLSISTYEDYHSKKDIINTSTSAYSKIHENHLNRKHDIFDECIAVEEQFYKNESVDNSRIVNNINRADTRNEQEEEDDDDDEPQEQKVVGNNSNDNFYDNVLLNRWLLMQIGIISDSISHASPPRTVEPLYSCCNNPVFIKNIQALDNTTIHTPVFINIMYLNTKEEIVSSSTGGENMDFVHTSILSNKEAILNGKNNEQTVEMLYTMMKSLGKPTCVGEYDHFVGKQQLYLSNYVPDHCDLVNIVESRSTETSYKLCYMVPFWKTLIESYLKSRNNINNDDCFGDGNTEVKDDNATTKNVVSYYERSDDYLLQEIDPTTAKKEESNNNKVESNVTYDTPKSYVNIDIVINDTRMVDIIPYINQQDIGKKNNNMSSYTYNNKYIYEKYVSQNKKDDIEKEDCVTIVVVPLHYGSNVEDNVVNLCTVFVYANNRFQDKYKYINELYKSLNNSTANYNGSRDSVVDTSDSLLIGPLLSNTMYTLTDLPFLIEQTVININNVYNKYLLVDPNGQFNTNLYKRSDMIEQIINGKNILYMRRNSMLYNNHNHDNNDEDRNNPTQKKIENVKYISRISKQDSGYMKMLL